MSQDFEQKKKQLVAEMQAACSIASEAVKQAFLSVAREKFFPAALIDYAYADSAFPIGNGQTISQPSTIAIMLEMLSVQKGNKVLEVGAGSGYVAALLSELVGDKGTVFGIELVHALHQQAVKALALLGCENVFLRCSDGTLGWKQEAPFDRIIVSAACRQIPEPLIEQLREKGKLVAPVGGHFSQEMVLIEKEKGKAVEKESRCCFVFVPLKGKHS